MDDRTYVFETKRTRVAYSQDGRYVIVMEKRSILDTIKSAWEATRVRWPCLIVLGLMAYVVLQYQSGPLGSTGTLTYAFG